MQNDSLYTARLRQVALYSDEAAEYGYGLEHEGFLSALMLFVLIYCGNSVNGTDDVMSIGDIGKIINLQLAP